MITLFSCGSPNVHKIVLMLEEIQHPYQLRPINIWAGDQFSEWFRALNPNSKVPVIVDSEGPAGDPYVLFESGAILIYLAEKAGVLLPTCGQARYDVLKWLMVQLSGMGPMFGQHFHFKNYAPERIEYACRRYANETARLIRLVDQTLAERPYLAGTDYSIADIAAWPWLRLTEPLGIDLSSHANLARWLDLVASRPAARRVLELIPGMDTTALMAKATPEQLDRFFGRPG